MSLMFIHVGVVFFYLLATLTICVEVFWGVFLCKNVTTKVIAFSFVYPDGLPLEVLAK